MSSRWVGLQRGCELRKHVVGARKVAISHGPMAASYLPGAVLLGSLQTCSLLYLPLLK